MAEPTLQAVFGTNASQTSTAFTITKADLTGLTASASNTAESLLVALLLKWKSVETTALLATNIDQSVEITDSFESLTTRSDTNTYRQKAITVNLYKLDSSSGVDPNDY